MTTNRRFHDEVYYLGKGSICRCTLVVVYIIVQHELVKKESFSTFGAPVAVTSSQSGDLCCWLQDAISSRKPSWGRGMSACFFAFGSSKTIKIEGE